MPRAAAGEVGVQARSGGVRQLAEVEGAGASETGAGCAGRCGAGSERTLRAAPATTVAATRPSAAVPFLVPPGPRTAPDPFHGCQQVLLSPF